MKSKHFPKSNKRRQISTFRTLAPMVDTPQKMQLIEQLEQS